MKSLTFSTHSLLGLLLLATFAGPMGARAAEPSRSDNSTRSTTPDQATLYKDKENAFTAALPPGWTAKRNEAQGEATNSYNAITVFETPKDKSARCLLYTADAGMEIPQEFVPQMSTSWINGWVKAMKRDTLVTNVSKLKKVAFHGSAVRCDIAYTSMDKKKAGTGYALVFAGKHTMYMAAVNNPINSPQAGRELEALVNSFHLEPLEAK